MLGLFVLFRGGKINITIFLCAYGMLHVAFECGNDNNNSNTPNPIKTMQLYMFDGEKY